MVGRKIAESYTGVHLSYLREMDTETNMAISVCLECPAGVPSFFLACIKERAYWQRNYEKRSMLPLMDTTVLEEWFETVEQYLETAMFINLCAAELIFFRRIPINHWNYCHN